MTESMIRKRSNRDYACFVVAVDSSICCVVLFFLSFRFGCGISNGGSGLHRMMWHFSWVTIRVQHKSVQTHKTTNRSINRFDYQIHQVVTYDGEREEKKIKIHKPTIFFFFQKDDIHAITSWACVCFFSLKTFRTNKRQTYQKTNGEQDLSARDVIWSVVICNNRCRYRIVLCALTSHKVNRKIVQRHLKDVHRLRSMNISMNSYDCACKINK